jgi:hypothetical protein
VKNRAAPSVLAAGGRRPLHPAPGSSHPVGAAARPGGRRLPAPGGARSRHPAVCRVMERSPESKLRLALGDRSFRLVAVRSVGPNKAG